MLTNQQKNQHLLWRAAFGPMIENVNQLEKISPKELLQLLNKTSSKNPKYIDVASGTVDGLVKGVQELGRMEKPTSEQRRQMRRQSAEDIKSLNLYWMSEMINSAAQLREKVSLFWHGHFACRVVNIYFQQQLLDVIRQNALGNFGDLLRAVSKTPAMLSFLNNQQNKKQHPNENFAREVMELFTMGRGNYSERDIKESARAYTGWGFNLKGEFLERKYLHDDGKKTFLGRTGNFDGDDIINIILEQKATAIFLTGKLYSFFVNEQVDEQRVQQLATGFYQSNYNIGQLLNSIFSADWFYDQQNIGTRIKSPVELMVGIRRMLPMQLERPEIQLLFQKTLGQVLFYPPNVAGWPGGKNWIDSSALMLRLRLPQILASDDTFSIRPKADDDVMMGKEGVDTMPKAFKINSKVDWKAITGAFSKVKRDMLAGTICNYLLQTKSRIPETVLSRFSDATSRDAFTRSVIVSVMSTPEYQLC